MSLRKKGWTWSALREALHKFEGDDEQRFQLFGRPPYDFLYQTKEPYPSYHHFGPIQWRDVQGREYITGDGPNELFYRIPIQHHITSPDMLIQAPIPCTRFMLYPLDKSRPPIKCTILFVDTRPRRATGRIGIDLGDT